MRRYHHVVIVLLLSVGWVSCAPQGLDIRTTPPVSIEGQTYVPVAEPLGADGIVTVDGGVATRWRWNPVGAPDLVESVSIGSDYKLQAVDSGRVVVVSRSSQSIRTFFQNKASEETLAKGPFPKGPLNTISQALTNTAHSVFLSFGDNHGFTFCTLQGTGPFLWDGCTEIPNSGICTYHGRVPVFSDLCTEIQRPEQAVYTKAEPSPAGGCIMRGGEGGQTDVWCPQIQRGSLDVKLTRINRVNDLQGRVMHLRWSPGGEWIFGSDDQGYAALWGVFTDEGLQGMLLRGPYTHSAPVVGVTWLDDDRVVAVQQDGTLTVWSASSGMTLEKKSLGFSYSHASFVDTDTGKTAILLLTDSRVQRLFIDRT